MLIESSCQCGAVFKAEDRSEISVRINFEEFQAHHKVCLQAKEGQQTSGCPGSANGKHQACDLIQYDPQEPPKDKEAI